MKTVYEASNSLDAHILLGLLKQAGIEGMVNGEYLQGAAGELPAFGLVKVMVRDEDFPLAADVVAGYQNSIIS